MRTCDLPDRLQNSTLQTLVAMPDEHMWWEGRYMVSQSGDDCRKGSWVFLRTRTESAVHDQVRQSVRTFKSHDGLSDVVEQHSGSDVPVNVRDGDDRVYAGRICAILVPTSMDGSTSNLEAAVVCVACYEVADVNDIRLDMPLLAPPCSGSVDSQFSIVSVKVSKAASTLAALGTD